MVAFAAIEQIPKDVHYIRRPSKGLPNGHCKGLIFFNEKGPDSWRSRMDPRELLHIKKGFFGDISFEYAILVLAINERVPLLHGQCFGTYEKCLEYEL